MGKSKFNPQEFARLYYKERLSLEGCAPMMGYAPNGLWHPAIKHGFVLRDHSSAQRLGYRERRKTPPTPKIPIEWERFVELYYVQHMTYREAAPFLGTSATTLQLRAVEEGYLSRRAVRRPNS